MTLTSLQFLLFALVFMICMNAVATAIARSIVLALANAVFLVSLFSSPLEALPLAAFLILGYAAIQHTAISRSRFVAGWWIAGLVVLFAWLRRYTFLQGVPELPFIYMTIGLSYILFRVIHLIVDFAQGEDVPHLTPLLYFSYTCNFLTFISGPIQRLQDFAATIARPEPVDEIHVRAALGRIVFGYVKILIISAIALYVVNNLRPELLGVNTRGWSSSVILYCASCGFYTAYLYYNFSGYMDVVIGLGLLVGLRLPENFNNPFISSSMIEFWGRWHMTLSNWFKQYLFNPLLQVSMERWPSSAAAPWLGVTAYFLVFLVMGIWHGSTSVFIIYGFVLGGSVAVNKLWQVLLTKRLGHKRYRALTKNVVYQRAGNGLTIGYYAVALTAFWVNWETLSRLEGRLHPVGIVASVLLLSVAWIVIAMLRDVIIALKTKLPVPIFKPLSMDIGSAGRLAALVLGCVAVQVALNQPPEFVYAGF